MDQQEYCESIIDHELVKNIKKETKCTKYVMQYSREFRIIIYILSTVHHLTYRRIIDYCQSKYGFSPSLGHIKQLIQDGEEALNGKAETHEETSHERPFSLNIEEIPKNTKSESGIQDSHNEKDKILKRKNELKFKKKHNDITISELRELWDLISLGSNDVDYYMHLLEIQDHIYKTRDLYIFYNINSFHAMFNGCSE